MGRTWRRIPGPPARVIALRFATPFDGWAYGPGLYSTHDGGAHWLAIPGVEPLSDLEASAAFAWRVGSRGLFSTDPSRDAWRPLSASPGRLAVTQARAYLLGRELLSFEGAAHEQRAVPCRGPLAASDTRLVLVCGSGGELALFTSTDGGVSWSAPQSVPAVAATAVAAQDGVVYVATPERLLVSYDGGLGWSEALRSSPTSVTAVGATVACISRGQLLLSKDRGQHWSTIAFP